MEHFKEMVPRINRLVAYLEVAQKKWAFTLRQATDIFEQVQTIRDKVNLITDATSNETNKKKVISFDSV